MQIIQNIGLEFETAVALGNFDGLHRAHMAVINNAVSYARDNNIKSGVLLFSNHPESVIKNSRVEFITPQMQKLELLKSSGVDFAYIKDFDADFMMLSPRDFATELKKVLNPRAVSVGYDYRFGYKAEGDVMMLKAFGEELGFDVIVAEKVSCNGEAVKSTKIRELIKSGKIECANEMLGRNFAISGAVVSGLQNGRKIGVPTANIDYDKESILPEYGVYMGYTNVAGKKYKSVINVGNNPTFNADKATVESHILDFNGDIYNEVVEAEFVKRIRDDFKFSNVDELKKQIEKDIKAVRECIL